MIEINNKSKYAAYLEYADMKRHACVHVSYRDQVELNIMREISVFRDACIYSQEYGAISFCVKYTWYTLMPSDSYNGHILVSAFG